MGKPKKGKKRDDDWEDDVADEIAALSIENQKDSGTLSDDQVEEPKLKKKEKKKKPKKVESEEEEDDIEVDEDKAATTTKGKSAGMSAFQMFAIDSDEGGNSSSSEEKEFVPQPVTGKNKKKAKQLTANEEKSMDPEDSLDIPTPVQPKSKGKKKGKPEKTEKKEDIDALLAEIEGPSKPEKGKKKKKGKAIREEEQPEEVEDEMEAAATSEPVTTTQDSSEKPGLEAMDLSTMTQEQIAAWLDDGEYEEDEKQKKKKKKAKKQEQKKAAEEADEEDKMDQEEGEENEGGTIKSAAQKKKEKKERQKQQKLLDKAKQQKKSSQKDATPETGTAAAEKVKEETPEPEADANKDEAGGEDEDKKKKKKDRKKKKGEEEVEEKKKKPSKMAKQIQEMQKKLREEEERLLREEEEKQRIIEEKQRQKEEQERKEKERKEKEKQKKKERIERLKAEGKYLTEKQKQEKQRASQMLQALQAQGLSLPDPGEKKKKIVYGTKKKKKDQEHVEIESPTETPTEEKKVEIKVEEKEATLEEKKDEIKDSWEDEDDVKDAWDAESEEESEKKESDVEKDKEGESDEEDDEDEDESESEEDSEEESSEEESEEEDEKLTPRERALARIQKRKEDAEKNINVDNLRAPVVCVLGHVDTGKTKILDKLRRTHVQDDEAGGITQQIGATNVPLEAIANQTKMCKEFSKQELKLPGLLIIDTPGHESFSNLRTRGSSLCDIAILVIDIMHGLEPQTIESINLLKKGKTPFIVALNKIDRLYQWQSNPHSDVVNTLKKQKSNTKLEFEERTQGVIVQLAEQGLNACLFNENKNVREYVSMVPTSAHSGDGMGNLLALVCQLTQTLLAKKLAYSEELQATVMEVKAIQGLGTTIDVILVNGSLHEGDTIIVAGQEGPIVTQVRALLMPQPMKELRVKNAYNKFKEVVAAQGCKIIAKDLEKSLAGLPLYVAQKQDEVEVYKEEIAEALEDILGSIKLQERGVFVQASTLGSLEALLEFLRTSKIPYAGINIGPVHKKDIMKASIMLEHDTQWAVILAFDVKVEREAQEMADSVGVTIFTAEIIYHLFDKFTAHRDQLKKQKQEEFKHIAVFPCKVRILPQYIFNSRDPIVCGVIIQAGFLKEGTPLCVPSKESLDLGRVTSIENNHKPVSKATKGQEVCIKIEPIPGDAPKMIGRHFDESDLLVSKLSRQSIDAVKNYFREEMTKADWQLIMELKKTFEIL